MTDKLTFIEEAQTKGFSYRPLGILGNGFYGNCMYVSLPDMEKSSKLGSVLGIGEQEEFVRINSEYFVQCENKSSYLTSDLLELFPDLREYQLHNFLNRFKDVFLSQKLFTVINRKRIFSVEAVRFIYEKVVKKDKPIDKNNIEGG